MNIQQVNASSLKKAAGLLHSGTLVAFPTETVYGLGADATSDRAVAEIFAVKGRPQFNPLIVHVRDVAMAKKFVAWNTEAGKLAQAFFPGPLTLILPRLPDSRISLLVSAGGDTVGIRVPSHKTAQALLKAADIPIAAPSANRSGRVSPTSAQHVHEELGDAVSMILDGGYCDVGIESTVVDISGSEPVLLRPGYVTVDQLESALGKKVAVGQGWDGKLKSPGLLQSHYAPFLPMHLNVQEPRSDEALLAFGASVPQGAKYTLNLSNAADLKEAAAHLFAYLRELDKPELYSAIAVMPVPDTGIGVAINDRLRRAAVR